MTKIKLTDKQRDVLKKMQEGWMLFQQQRPNGTLETWIQDKYVDYEEVTVDNVQLITMTKSVLNALIKVGLVEKVKVRVGDWTTGSDQFVLTKKGEEHEA